MNADGGRVVRIAGKGDGMTADGRFVPLSAPGDLLHADGRLEHGPHHAEPPCRHYPACGGCQLQHVDDGAYADYVRERVAGALAGQGLAADAISEPVISPPRTRRRAALRAVRVGKRVLVGFSGEKSHHIIDMAECHILHPRLFALVAPLRALLTDLLGAKDSAQIKMTLADQGLDVLLEGVSVEGLKQIEALNDFAAKHRLARLSLDDGFGPQSRYEPEPVTISFGGVAVSMPPYAFLQATAEGEAALLEAVRPAFAGVKAGADLFCGLGTFALALSDTSAIYAAEAARGAVLALKGAANRAGRHVAADHRDLFRRPLVPDELNRFGAILLDPPRAGAREQAAQLAQSMVPVIAYVSCNPGSFARDARMLVEGGYRIESVQPVGQFRWSTHVELAAILRR